MACIIALLVLGVGSAVLAIIWKVEEEVIPKVENWPLWEECLYTFLTNTDDGDN